MNSDVVRWFIGNKCKNERDRCNSQLHDRQSDSVVKSIVLKLVFLVLVINFNIGLVLADKDVYGPDDGSGHYTPHWAVHIPDVTEETAQRVADEHGFIYLGKVSDWWQWILVLFTQFMWLLVLLLSCKIHTKTKTTLPYIQWSCLLRKFLIDGFWGWFFF